MTHAFARRQFLQTVAAGAAAISLAPEVLRGEESTSKKLPYKVSLAEWSLHKTLYDSASGITNLDFPTVARNEFGIDGIEYVNQFFKDKANDKSYLSELKKRCDNEGVTSLLIMVDGEGNLGHENTAERTKAVENHYRWVEAAKFLGCHSIRVNAASSGSYLEQINRASDGLRQLSEFAKPHGINVIVENHGGLSSNAAWLAVVIERVGMDNCGTLPDFGNFYISRGDKPDLFDRYHGVQALMPYAKAVSAKTYDFDDQGNETTIDYRKMMSIVIKAGYSGYVGIEYEGGRLGEFDGIRASKKLLDTVAQEMA